jgi:hypothetical protein
MANTAGAARPDEPGAVCLPPVRHGQHRRLHLRHRLFGSTYLLPVYMQLGLQAVALLCGHHPAARQPGAGGHDCAGRPLADRQPTYLLVSTGLVAGAVVRADDRGDPGHLTRSGCWSRSPSWGASGWASSCPRSTWAPCGPGQKPDSTGLQRDQFRAHAGRRDRCQPVRHRAGMAHRRPWRLADHTASSPARLAAFNESFLMLAGAVRGCWRWQLRGLAASRRDNNPGNSSCNARCAPLNCRQCRVGRAFAPLQHSDHHVPIGNEQPAARQPDPELHRLCPARRRHRPPCRRLGHRVLRERGRKARRGIRHFVDKESAATSPLAHMLRSFPIKSHNVIAHVRKATMGAITLENCHPFVRELWGRYWVFAHNGDLKDFAPTLHGNFRPVGDTDSELAFCWLMQELAKSHAGVPSVAELTPDAARAGAAASPRTAPSTSCCQQRPGLVGPRQHPAACGAQAPPPAHPRTWPARRSRSAAVIS